MGVVDSNVKADFGRNVLLRIVPQSNFKNHRIFMLRCISKGVIPVSVRLESTRNCYGFVFGSIDQRAGT